MNRTDDLSIIIGELRAGINNIDKQRTECFADRRKKEKLLNTRLENIKKEIEENEK